MPVEYHYNYKYNILVLWRFYASKQGKENSLNGQGRNIIHQGTKYRLNGLEVDGIDLEFSHARVEG